MTTAQIYKNSGIEWIGDIPDDWEIKKLKYIGEAITGLTYSPNDITNENNGRLVLRASNIKDGKIVLEDNVYVNMDIPIKLITKVNDILICSRNGSRKLIGKSAKIEEDSSELSWGAFNTVFRTHYSDFIYYIFQSPLFTFRIGTFLTSTINQLTIGNLYNIEIPLPPTSTQYCIVNYLNLKVKDIDLLIESKQKLIEILEEKRQSIITEAVTKGINPYAKMKDSGVEWIGEIPEHWNIKKLSYVSKITRLAGYEYTTYWQPTEDGEIVALRGQNIGINTVNIIGNEERITESLSQRLIRSRLFEGDVVFPCVGSIGKAACIYENNKYHINQNIAKLTPTADLDSEFLTYFLNSSITLFQIDWYNSSEMQPSVLVGNLRKFKIVVPNIHEQKEIVKSIKVQLSDLMKLTKKVNHQIQKLKEYRQSLIYEAVTGKIDVRELVVE